MNRPVSEKLSTSQEQSLSMYPWMLIVVFCWLLEFKFIARLNPDPSLGSDEARVICLMVRSGFEPSEQSCTAFFRFDPSRTTRSRLWLGHCSTLISFFFANLICLLLCLRPLSYWGPNLVVCQLWDSWPHIWLWQYWCPGPVALKRACSFARLHTPAGICIFHKRIIYFSVEWWISNGLEMVL